MVKSQIKDNIEKENMIQTDNDFNRRIAIFLCKIFIPPIIIMMFINRWAFIEQFNRFYDLFCKVPYGFLFWLIVTVLLLIILKKIIDKYRYDIIKFVDRYFPNEIQVEQIIHVCLLMFFFIGTILFLMMLGSIEYHYPTNGTSNFINNINESSGYIGLNTLGSLYLSGYEHHWSMDAWIVIFSILILITYHIIKDIFKSPDKRWFEGIFYAKIEEIKEKDKISEKEADSIILKWVKSCARSNDKSIKRRPTTERKIWR
jgi:hypothetical protein